MSRLSQQVVTLKIDGRDVGARSNETILEVAHENDINIPSLCSVEGLSVVGSCRLCLVEVRGTSELVSACSTYVREGMDIVTHSERLSHYRQTILSLFFSERNHLCAVCVSNNHCELQGQAQALGLSHVEVAYRYPQLPVDASHERFVIDHNRCILCTRCVRVCDEIERAHTWDVAGRGVQALVITDLNEPWGSSETCTSCGKCVQVCPTGALFEKGKAVAEMSRRRRFLPYLAKTKEKSS
ncbi:MAG: bidirectional hydrogenase complex protein HoxU [Chloroflexaceae bacterium]|nr:bidirectional hydrogenase complex protein HoxU [Chloroflexaceae bacterium]